MHALDRGSKTNKQANCASSIGAVQKASSKGGNGRAIAHTNVYAVKRQRQCGRRMGTGGYLPIYKHRRRQSRGRQAMAQHITQCGAVHLAGVVVSCVCPSWAEDTVAVTVSVVAWAGTIQAGAASCNNKPKHSRADHRKRDIGRDCKVRAEFASRLKGKFFVPCVCFTAWVPPRPVVCVTANELLSKIERLFQAIKTDFMNDYITFIGHGIEINMGMISFQWESKLNSGHSRTRTALNGVAFIMCLAFMKPLQ